ncbi:TPA: hypothetical protein RQL09_002084 [Vibrio vulnificus]|nr:hypothetical protein [Vibrio vulnificus]HDY8162197.1 hypothetical protein [Vibrio vulnificus]
MRIFDRLFSKKKSLVQDTISNTISNDYTTHATQRVFDTISNADLLPLAAQRLKNVAPEISQGHMFEIDQAAKFCKDAIKKNSALFARTTESLGMPHDPVDILISNGKETLKKYQAKSSHSAASTIRMLKDKKYDGMGRVGGSEHYDKACDLMDQRLASPSIKSKDLYADTRKTYDKSIRCEDVVADNTTYDDAKKLTDPKYAQEYANRLKNEAVWTDIHYSGLKGGQIGAGIAGSVSLATGLYDLYKNEAEIGEVLLNTTTQAGKGFATGYVSTAMSKGIIHGGTKLLGESTGKMLSRSNAPMAIATTVVSASKSMLSYMNGEITSDELLEEVSYTVISGASVFYYGAWGQAVIPIPVVGGLIGAGVGFMISNMLQQSGMIALGDASVVKAAKERRAAIEAICAQAIPQMQKERAAMEKIIDEHFRNQAVEFSLAFDEMDLAMTDWNADKFIVGLNRINAQLGHSLPFSNFQEFDAMMRSPEPLKF